MCFPCLEPDPQHDCLVDLAVCLQERAVLRPCVHGTPETLSRLAGHTTTHQRTDAILGIFVTLIFVFIVLSLLEPWESASTPDKLIAVHSVL